MIFKNVLSYYSLTYFVDFTELSKNNNNNNKTPVARLNSGSEPSDEMDLHTSFTSQFWQIYVHDWHDNEMPIAGK